MSMFSYRPSWRSFGVLLAVVAVVAGSVYFGRVVSNPLTASQLDAVVPSFTPLVARETIFPEPQRIEWDGAVIGVLAGGEGLAVRRTDTGEMFQAYMPIGVLSSISDGPVRIRGTLTGISCGYAQTLFGGQCTLSVEIETVEQLPIFLL